MTDLASIRISEHAVDRYLERGGTLIPGQAEADLTGLLARGREVEVPWGVRRVWPSTSKAGTRYFKAAGWILVVTGPTLVTCFQVEGPWRWA